MLNITDTRVRLVENSDSQLKAIASIVIDGCFAIHDIKIIEGKDGLFIAMPSRKTAEGNFKDIAHPINSEARAMVKEAIIDRYQKALEEI
jgi:stage V sporulation protein G